MKSITNQMSYSKNKNKTIFHKSHPFKKRKEEAERILKKYPDRVPVIVQRVENNDTIPDIDKKKYLVPQDLTVGQFTYVIRKRINLSPEQAIFVFVNNTLPPSASLMSQIYKEHKDSDFFLYFEISGESTFGAKMVNNIQ